MSKVNIKYCIVPQCQSTSIRTPGKIFISLPATSNNKNLKKRRLWLRAIKRDVTDLSQNTRGFVCADHFNLEEDMENYVRHQLMGGKIYLKEHVVPHIFHCQVDRKRSSNISERNTSIKRLRKNLVNTLLGSEDNIPSTSTEPPILDTNVISTTALEVISDMDIKPSTSSEKSSQTFHPVQRTVSTQYRPCYRSKLVQTEEFQTPRTINVACSPFKSTKVDHLPSPSCSNIYSSSEYIISSESHSTIIYGSSDESSSRYGR